MKPLRILAAVTALAAVGCGDLPTAQKQAARKQPDAAQKFAVGKDIDYGNLFAQDDRARRASICLIAQGIIQRQVSGPSTFPSCTGDQSQVEAVADGNYAIRSWVDLAQGRTYYSGEAVIAEENGKARTIRITRLDVEGGAR